MSQDKEKLSDSTPLSIAKNGAYLGKNSKVVGKLSFTGPAELDGYVEGEIESQDRLTIGDSAVINAKINGTEVVIRGQVTGDIVTTKKLSLHRQARVVGSVTSANLSVDEGAVLEGKCTMTTPQPDPVTKGGAGHSTAAAQPSR